MTENVSEPVMKDVRPFYGRVTVSPTKGDVEEQTASGLIVPVTGNDGERFLRGILLHVAADPPPGSGADVLEPGMVIFYRRGTRILDVVVVDLPDIIAYEA